MKEQEQTILIVEDEGLQALAINEILRPSGYRILGTASSAEDAMRMVHATAPALAVIDVSLGTPTSGITLARHLAKRYGTRIVFVTGNQAAVIREAPEFATTVLSKPFVADDLIEMVKRALTADPRNGKS